MDRGSKTALLGRKASYCLLAAQLLAAPLSAFAEGQEAAVDAPAEADTTKLGASASLTYGFKPEFNQGEDDGRYRLGRIGVRATVKDRVRVSLSQSIVSVDSPEPSTQVMDPSLGLSYLPNLLDGSGLSLSSGLALSLGMSKDSLEAHYLGGARAFVSVAGEVGKLTPSVGGAFVKHVRRYTMSADGVPATSHVISGSIGLDYAWDANFSASIGVEYRKSVKYVGKASYVFENSIGLGYAATKHLSLELGLSTADTQRNVTGRDNNELEFYRQNKSEMYVSASYAL